MYENAIIKTLKAMLFKMFNWCLLCAIFEAIDREKPEKFRKLQEATRSAQALVDQLTSGKRDYFHMHINSFDFRPLIFNQSCIISKLALVFLLKKNVSHFIWKAIISILLLIKLIKSCIMPALLIIDGDVHRWDIS